MPYLWITLLLLGTFSTTVQFVSCFYPDDEILYRNLNQSEPLILTPLLESGMIQRARDSSRVFLQDSAIVSYAGFFTVNEKTNASLFFWFFPAIDGNSGAPLLLSLQGGPGTAVVVGVCLENGPFFVSNDLKLRPRPYSWTASHSVLYIDSPVGAGFSFSNPGGYSRSEHEVAEYLYETLLQFFALFPEYRQNEFFVTGESYVGKFAPRLCQIILQGNPTAPIKINLKGMAIGNPYSDPTSVFGSFADYYYQVGLLDDYGREIFNENQRAILAHIERSEWLAAYDRANVLTNAIDGDTEAPSIFKDLTGFSFKFNLLHAQDYRKNRTDLVVNYFSSKEVRDAIHVGDSTRVLTIKNEMIIQYLLDEVMQSVKHIVEYLLEHIRVLFYSGQIDNLIPFPFGEKFANKLRFSGDRSFSRARRTLWNVGGELAGYAKSAGNLSLMMIRNAGHQVPLDQPKWALDMITKFVRGLDF